MKKFNIIIILCIILLSALVIMDLTAPTSYSNGYKVFNHYWDMLGNTGVQNGSVANVSCQNNCLAYLPLINNTNLAPTFAGTMNGTGERIQGTTYFTNSSQIEIFVFAHSNKTSLSVDLNINGTMLQQSKGAQGITDPSDDIHGYVTGIIPKNTSYLVNVTDFHHYEWREYTYNWTTV